MVERGDADGTTAWERILRAIIEMKRRHGPVKH